MRIFVLQKTENCFAYTCLYRGLRACWGIMGNQGKRKEDGGRVWLVMLLKLSCFEIVCGFSLVKRKTDIKNSSLENIAVDYCDP